MNYLERIPAPTPESINTGLSVPRQEFLIAKLGKPREVLTQTCLPITNPNLKPRIVTMSVGPFRVTGLIPAVESLRRIFDHVLEEKPALYEQLGTAGMLCCRYQRGSTNRISSHAWGTAIDIKIGGVLDTFGDGMVLRGLLELYRYFKAEGWYWGAEFKGPREDGMHFEVAKETLAKWYP